MTATDEGIAAAEELHGFVFGDPDGDHAAAMQAAVPNGVVSCVTPTCTLRGHHVQVYADTPVPIHCGRCSAILLDDPNRTDASIITGVDMTTLDDVIAETKRQVIAELRNAGHLK